MRLMTTKSHLSRRRTFADEGPKTFRQSICRPFLFLLTELAQLAQAFQRRTFESHWYRVADGYAGSLVETSAPAAVVEVDPLGLEYVGAVVFAVGLRPVAPVGVVFGGPAAADVLAFLGDFGRAVDFVVCVPTGSFYQGREEGCGRLRG